MICGVYTRLMSVRESTSIELPRALSGSNVLMAWPGVASTRTVPADWPNAGVASTVSKNAIWAETRAAVMSSCLEGERRQRTENWYAGGDTARNRDCGVFVFASPNRFA